MTSSHFDPVVEKDRDLSIWAVTEYYHPNFSGAAIQAHRILSRLASRGFSVCVWTTADQAARDLSATPVVLDEVQIEYLPVVRRRPWDRLRHWTRMRSAVLALNQTLRSLSFQIGLAWRLLRRGRRGDVLQLYIVDDFTWLAIAAARLRRMHPVIQVSLMGADDPMSFRPSLLGLSTAIKRACFHRVDKVIGLSSALTQSCEMSGVEPWRIERIPNGVDLQQFAPAPAEKSELRGRLRLSTDRRYVVFVGSALMRKGIDVVVNAFIKGGAQLDDVDLLVVGPCEFSDRTRHDPSRQKLVNHLRGRLDDHGMTSRVHWIGQVNNVQEYLQAADLFFFPTRREGLPNALAESMACGLPALASRLEGITTDLVRDGQDGLLIAGHNPTDYATVLQDLLRQPSRMAEMGRSARQRIEDEFSLELAVERYAQLYRSLAEKKRQENSFLDPC